MTVVQLHKQSPCAEIPATLRRIADDIEAGDHGDWPVTTAVLVLGHTDAEYLVDDERVQRNYWTTFGLGPRADIFTVRGLLATVLSRWSHADE